MRNLMFLFAGLASPALAASPARDEAPDMPWSISIDGGTSITVGNADQWSAGATLTRDIGDGFVSLAYARLKDEGIPGSVLAPATRTDQLTLSAAYTFGKVSLDASFGYGWRKFEPAALAGRLGRTITIDGDGRALSLGGGISAEFALDAHTALSPSVSVTYDESDTGRVVVLPVRGAVVVSKREKGVTGNFGLTLSRSFGAEDRHSISAHASYITTSNAAAPALLSGNRGSRSLRPRTELGGSADWFDYGASLGLGLTDRLSLNLDVSSTAGFAGPEVTSLSAGLEIRF